MKRIVISLIVVLTSGILNAQQIPQYSQYLRNQFMINPGAAGVYDFVDLTMSGRWQWAGFGDEPRTAYLAVTTPLTKKPRPRYNPALRISEGPVRNPEIKTGKFKHALGGQLIADQYGAFRTVQLAGTYAIHIPVSKNYNLSFGTRVGLSNHTFLADKAKVLYDVSSGAYGSYDQTYNSFASNNSGKYIMDIGAGLYLYSKKAFFGIAADQLTRDLVEFGSSTANFNNQIHFNVTAGYKFDVNDNVTLTPAILFKMMSPAPPTIEGSVQVEYKEWLWGGISYRHTDAFVGMVGLNINNHFKLGYSYDYALSRFNTFSSGGHELVLGYMFR